MDDVCSDGGRSSGCRDTSGGEGDADDGSSNGDENDRGDGGSIDGDESDTGDGDNSDGDESDVGDGQGSNVLNAFLTKGGCCKDSCLMQYSDLAKIRAHSLAALNKKTKKAVVLGMLALVRQLGF